MCYRCIEIDAQILRYRRLSNGINHPEIVKSFQATLVELDAQKASLHSELPRLEGDKW
jgi:hypothetical protein